MTASRGRAGSCRPDSPEYPELLRTLTDRPAHLNFRGDPSPRSGLAIVGSRRPTPYGRRIARRLAGEAAARGLVVVSGLARGIDGEAHQGALDRGGITWAVLGSGLDRVYPPEHAALAERIVAGGGCLWSEFPPGTSPRPDNFPRRNRVISGASWATLVVEGRLGSGSLITARLAADQGREVLAVPGPVDSPLSDAPNLLIREGAGVVRNVSDLLEALPPELRSRGRRDGLSSARDFSGLPENWTRILRLLEPGGSSFEDIVSASGLDLSAVSHILFHMEMEGLIESLAGQRYAAR